MKPVNRWTFRSLQLRLMIYLLLMGLLPLSAAIVLFARDAALQRNNELQSSVTQTHRLILARMDDALAGAERAAKAVSQDPAVLNQFSDGGDRELSAVSPERQIIFQLLNRQLSLYPYLTNLCISWDKPEDLACAKDQPLLPILPGEGAKGKRFEAGKIKVLQRKEEGVRFIGPVIDGAGGGPAGTVLAELNLGALLTDLHRNTSVAEQVLYDHQGQMIYSGSLANRFDAAGNPEAFREHAEISGKRPVSYIRYKGPGVYWWSRLEADLGPGSSSIPFGRLLAYLPLIIACSLLLSFLGTLLFTRNLTGPLKRLRGLMERAEKGDLKAYWTLKSAPEIDDLGESYNQMLNRLEELIKQVKREEALKKEAEIEALQYQLNPHFLYNTLNTIKWVAKIHKTPQISEAVSALVRLLQASLGKKGDFISVREEIGLIRDYMEIQSFRYGEKVTVLYDIDPLAATCLVPRLILQPLVENAIVHGIAPADGQGIIEVRSWIGRDFLYCEVEDNGVGMQEAAALESVHTAREIKERMSGIGLHHIREKMQLYYGSEYTMDILPKASRGTIIRLSFPVHQSEVL